MAEKNEVATYFGLRKEIEQAKFRNIYVLHGEEPYYIDRLSEMIVEAALAPDERDFNLHVFYGNECTAADVVNACKQYPVFSERCVVVLHEAQLLVKPAGHRNDFDLFKAYAESPLSSTILVICHKTATLKSKPLLDAIKSHRTGVVFASDKVRRDRDLADLIVNYAASNGCNIDTKATAMLADFIGNDLSRLFGELDKLRLLVGPDNRITPELIERNVGISKDFNNFELEDALIKRDALKAYRIVDYFKRNPKNNAVPVTVAMIYGFFSSVLIVRASRDKSSQALMAATGSKSAFRVGKFQEAARNYSTQACVNILGYIRECDVKSKGIDSRQDAYELLRELIYKILHSPSI